MFSVKEKIYIAAEIEKILLNLNHPEMPKERPNFKLYVAGKKQWSWADILPNWAFEVKHRGNPWNETARDVMGEASHE